MNEPASPPRLIHYRWDLDKTYLRTDFDTTRDLVRTFLQRADEKSVVPGAPTLLRELLRASPDDDAVRRVTFISGSPRQMRRVLTDKLRLDGIEPDVFVLKPNLSNLLRFRFQAIRSQLGYKLGALLSTRITGRPVDELLFGDDAEQDAMIYNLYRDLVAGHVSAAQLEWILSRTRTQRAERAPLLELARALRPDPQLRVRRIFIHLARRSPTRRFDLYGPDTVPVFNWFQAALVLRADGLLPPRTLLSLTTALGLQGYTAERLANSTWDLVRRGFVDDDLVDRVRSELSETSSEHDETPPGVLAQALASRLDGPRPRIRRELPPRSPVDYTRAVQDLERYRTPRLDLGDWKP